MTPSNLLQEHFWDCKQLGSYCAEDPLQSNKSEATFKTCFRWNLSEESLFWSEITGNCFLDWRSRRKIGRWNKLVRIWNELVIKTFLKKTSPPRWWNTIWRCFKLSRSRNTLSNIWWEEMLLQIMKYCSFKYLVRGDVATNPTPRNALSVGPLVRSFVTFFTPSNANAHQSYMWACTLDFLKKGNNNLNDNNSNNNNNEEKEELDDDNDKE